MQTWAEGVQYTFETRDSWRRGSARVTRQINCGHVSRHLGSDFLLSDFNQSVIHQLSLALEDEGKSDGTINLIVNCISTVLNHLVFMEQLESAPKFKMRPLPEGRRVYFTKEQVEHLASAASSGLSDLILFGAYTGLRSGEVFKLKPEDIDLERNLIHVGGTASTTTKAKNHRVVPIHDRIFTLITRRMHHVTLFEDYNKALLCRHFRKLLTQEGFSDLYSYHVLRHSFATWCNTNGTPIRTIQELLGHKKINTTEIYVKVTDEAKLQALASL